MSVCLFVWERAGVMRRGQNIGLAQLQMGLAIGGAIRRGEVGGQHAFFDRAVR